MAITFSSPGINVTEYEVKSTTISPSGTVGAFAGVFKWGPVNKIINVKSEADLVNLFGKPTNDQLLYSSNVSVAESFFSAANFLQYSSNLNVVRSGVVLGNGSASNTLSYNASTKGNTAAISANDSSSAIQVLNEDQWIKDFDGLNVAQNNNSRPYFIARYPGDLGNALAVYVCSSTNGFSQPCYIRVSANSSIENTKTPKSNNSTSVTFNNAFNVEFLGANNSKSAGNTTFKANNFADFTLYDYITITDSGNDNKSPTRISKCQITASNNTTNQLTLVPVNSNAILYRNSTEANTLGTPGANTTSVKATVTWQFADQFSSGAPTTTSYAAAANTKNDEMHILVVDKTGKITGVAGTVLEKYEGVSKCSDAKSDTGRSTYYVQRIFEDSKYIYVGNHLDSSWGNISSSGTTMATANNYPSENAKTNDKVTAASSGFGGGQDGTFSTDGSDIINSLSLFSSKARIDLDLIFSGCFGRNVKEYICSIASTRKDCIAFISPERTTSIPSASNNLINLSNVVPTNVSDIVKEVTGSNDAGDTTTFSTLTGQGALQTLSSYCVMDSGWKYQYDKYNNNNKWIALNADIAGLCAATDVNYGSWYSPAGFTRGRIKNAIRLSFNPSQTDRDQLYPNGINPVVTFPEGTFLFGDKTLSPTVSAFDRINVRRLFISLEKTISKASKAQLFEFNDQFTRAQFVAMVDPFLRSIQASRGIYDYRVVCDESNNTPAVIDANQFVGDIYIKPSKSVNFIQLNFVAVATGIDFTTMLG